MRPRVPSVACGKHWPVLRCMAGGTHRGACLPCSSSGDPAAVQMSLKETIGPGLPVDQRKLLDVSRLRSSRVPRPAACRPESVSGQDLAQRQSVTPMYGPAVRRKGIRRVGGLRSCINVSGLCLEQYVAPGHHGFQRTSDLISGQALMGCRGHQCSDMPGRPSSISSFSLADLGGGRPGFGAYIACSLFLIAFPLFDRRAFPSPRPTLSDQQRALGWSRSAVVARSVLARRRQAAP